MKNDLIILFSGGSDSALILEYALDTGYHPHCILVDYEQNQKIELEFATRYLNDKSIPYQIVKLHGLGLSSALTTGEKRLYSAVNEMYVPSRNLMFVSIAASIAENLGINKIWYGADLSDALTGFPDCMNRWVDKVNELLEINGSFQLTLEAPILHLTKESVLAELDKRGVDMSKLFSGYLEDN